MVLQPRIQFSPNVEHSIAHIENSTRDTTTLSLASEDAAESSEIESKTPTPAHGMDDETAPSMIYESGTSLPRS